MGEKKVNRRDYLKYTGAAIGGLVVGGALGYLLKPSEVIEKTATVTAPGVEKTVTVTVPGATVTAPGAISTVTVPKTVTEVGKKPAEGMTFTLMMGALSPDPFWVVVARGAEDAQNQLGAKVEINWGKHDVDYDITKIEEAIARKVDGIGMNFWKIEAFKDAVQKALNTGINFIGFNSDDPTTGRLWYIGQDLVIAGEVLGKYVLNKWGLKKGDVVAWAQMFPSATYSIKRTEGLKRVFDPAGVKLVGIETTWEIPEMISRMTAWLQANPKPVGILFDGGQILMGSEELLKPLGYKAGDIPCGGFDLNPKVGELIQNGWVDVTIDQQPYLQGYLTVYSLYLAKFGNFVLPDINTGSYVVDKSNIDKVMKGIELGIR